MLVKIANYDTTSGFGEELINTHDKKHEIL